VKCLFLANRDANSAPGPNSKRALPYSRLRGVGSEKARSIRRRNPASEDRFHGQKVQPEPDALIGSIDGEMINTAKELIAALQNVIFDAAQSPRERNKGSLRSGQRL
jgi:hypothetical protein